LGTLKKKISEIRPCLLYFKNRRKFYFFGGRKRPVGTWWVNAVSALEKLVYMQGFHHRMSKFKEASLSMSSLLNLLHSSPDTGRMSSLRLKEDKGKAGKHPACVC
jgi:hypothetical protein